MKYRLDFVTNSSSSSFIISKKYLDKDQIKAIYLHSELGEKLGIDYYKDSWSIDENETFISGYTYMDNFDFYEFLEQIDVDMDKVEWDEFPFDIYEYKSEELEEPEYIEEKINWRQLLKEL